MHSPSDWLAARTPPAPGELMAWLKIPEVRDPDGDPASMSRALVEAGIRHLEVAVARPGRDRMAAYQLLAADAAVTYGCEAASEADDVGGVLREILARVSTGRAVE